MELNYSLSLSTLVGIHNELSKRRATLKKRGKTIDNDTNLRNLTRYYLEINEVLKKRGVIERQGSNLGVCMNDVK